MVERAINDVDNGNKRFLTPLEKEKKNYLENLLTKR